MKKSIPLIALCLMALPAVAEDPGRVYENKLTPLKDPEPILADHPEFFQPIVEVARYEAPTLVQDENADLSVRAWRWSYNARGIIEMPNFIDASKTAIVVVHPWGIDDDNGWISPEPAGVAFNCTPIKNEMGHRQQREVLDPFLNRLRGKVKYVLHSLPGKEDPIRAKIYRSLDLEIPTAEERAEGLKELEAKLKGFHYIAGDLPETIALSDESPVRDYFKQFPGLDSGDHYNGKGFWDLPIPITTALTNTDEDIVAYDLEGYEKIRDTLKEQGIEHILMTGYATDMCYISTTAGWQNFSPDFNVFLVGDATMATFPANSSAAYATNAAISFASLNQLVTQTSWVKENPTP
ncbi:MAG: isochorismatase family protein [Candidatus Omnitrophica bacterium]|nr:isochorismatase family protein [Candidatus Omnitrophota bacterium]MCB9781994.1 isochorismatase family protein [Candidatus Omnitrophota bacterium]